MNINKYSLTLIIFLELIIFIITSVLLQSGCSTNKYKNDAVAN